MRNFNKGLHIQFIVRFIIDLDIISVKIQPLHFCILEILDEPKNNDQLLLLSEIGKGIK